MNQNRGPQEGGNDWGQDREERWSREKTTDDRWIRMLEYPRESSTSTT